MSNFQKPIEVIIADDHPVYRHGLAKLLESDKSIKVVAETDNGSSLLIAVKKYHPDVVISDISMPSLNGNKAFKEIGEVSLAVPCVVLSMHDEPQIIGEVMNSGALGYVVKSSSTREIIEAVKTAKKGKPYLCKISSNRVLSNTRLLTQRFEKDILSVRELEIIRLIKSGNTSRQIAAQLFRGKRSIDRDRTVIFKKLNVSNTAELIAIAIAKGLV